MSSYRQGFGHIDHSAKTASGAWIGFVKSTARKLPLQVKYAMAFIAHDVEYEARMMAPTSEGSGRSKIAPGYLRRSGYARTEMMGRFVIRSVVGFDAPYAADVHNTDLNYRHGQSNFLRLAFSERASTQRLNRMLRTNSAHG